MPFYFPTLDQHGGMEKKVYEVRSLLMAYAQFESYLTVIPASTRILGNSLFQEQCHHFISFVIEPSATSLLFSFVVSFVVFDVLGSLWTSFSVWFHSTVHVDGMVATLPPPTLSPSYSKANLGITHTESLFAGEAKANNIIAKHVYTRRFHDRSFLVHMNVLYLV